MMLSVNAAISLHITSPYRVSMVSCTLSSRLKSLAMALRRLWILITVVVEVCRLSKHVAYINFLE